MYKLRTQRFEWKLFKNYVGSPYDSKDEIGTFPTLEAATEALNEAGGEFRLHSDYHGSYTLHLSSDWVTIDNHEI